MSRHLNLANAIDAIIEAYIQRDWINDDREIMWLDVDALRADLLSRLAKLPVEEGIVLNIFTDRMVAVACPACGEPTANYIARFIVCNTCGEGFQPQSCAQESP